MEQIFKKKQFTVEVVHFKQGNGHYNINEGDKLIARNQWPKDAVYYETNEIPRIMEDVKALLEELKF